MDRAEWQAGLARCRLCPRACGANRAAGQRGVCGAAGQLEIYRHGLHDGEEPPISGRRGSGTVFFSRCTLRCLYCQNYPWSQGGEGRSCSSEELAAILKGLHAQGAHNWNLVSPTPWLPWILEALAEAERVGVALPVVYNTSGFEAPTTLEALEGRVAVYLTDLRYAQAESAAQGSGYAGYVEAARAALLEMWKQTGPLKTDASGIAVSGTICRLLVLPGRAGEAAENLRWLAETVGPRIPVSVMAQYTPAYKAAQAAPWNRRVTRQEYDAVVAEAERLGFAEGWIQEYDSPTPDNLVGFMMKPAQAPARK